MPVMIFSLVLSLILLLVFFFLSKMVNWEALLGSVFECGFSSYFFSRFSFSSHYFIIGLIFLFLDLELCLLFPFFVQFQNSPITSMMGWFFALVLLAGLVGEWALGALEWTYWT